MSSYICSNIVESSDCIIVVGPVFNDYSTVGWTTLTPMSKLIHIGPNFVNILGNHFSRVILHEFLISLAKIVPRKPASINAFYGVRRELQPSPEAFPSSMLTNREFSREIQATLSSNMDLLVETGDSWFIGQKLFLPDNCNYFIQFNYGSIGWSVGATLGIALGMEKSRRLISLIGDGSFQMTFQEVSTMISQQLNPIIIVINNGGYTIEREIHDGPYNKIQNWKYSKLIDAFNVQGGNAIGLYAATAGAFTSALQQAISYDGLALIECILGKDDCTAELLEWGNKVSAANGRI